MKKNSGFTLIEVMVVVTILGVLSLIAVPRFFDIQARTVIYSDSTTAERMIKTARLIETEQFNTVNPGTALTTKGEWAVSVVDGENYLTLPVTPQSGGIYNVSIDANNNYIVKWTPTGRITSEQTFTEGSLFVINP